MSDKDNIVLRQIYRAADRMGVADIGTLDSRLDARYKTYFMRIYFDESHPMHNFLRSLPSGRLLSYKARCACGTNSFIKHMIDFINSTVYTGRS